LDDSKNYFNFSSKKPFFQNELNESYARFSEIGKKNGVKVVFSKYTNYSKGFVDNYWIFDEKWLVCKKRVKPDLFYDKFPFNEKGKKLKQILTRKNKLFNNYFLENFCKDKFLQYKKFSNICPKTFLIKNKKDLLHFVKKLDSEKIILKPRFGHGGFGIKIFNKDDKLNGIKFHSDYVLQEFLNTSKGFPNSKFKKIHDFRCVIINGKLAYSYLRIPKKGLLANLHQGGKAMSVSCPKKIMSQVKEIDLFMKNFGNRVYSTDFFFSNGKYYLIELNSKPGFDVCGKHGFAEKENCFFELFFKKIVKNFIKNS
jgi:glutathione synthase/RimK-type ligase-like ATP-grasp enzyme